ncbi:MAG: HD domain-containing phosphohydrolase [Desulfovibrionaceae bacterium]
MERVGERETILVVDDLSANIAILSELLGDEYRVKAATSGEKALRVAFENPPDLVLLDVMMPEMDGYEVCRRLKDDPRTRRVPVIFVTAMGETEDEAHGLGLGAADYITKPIRAAVVRARVKTQLALYDQSRALERKVRERTAELDETRLQIIRRLSLAAEFKDNETGLHLVRMSQFSRIIALAVGMDVTEADLILHAAPMHDVGKIGIPDKILLKPGPLTAEERLTMQSHTTIGGRIIGTHASPLLRTARDVALTHHEKWDGGGYPRGLAGEDIPLVGRIVAVADVFDALTSRRPYKEAWSMERAVAELERGAGGHFDPALVPAFLGRMDEVVEVMEANAEMGGESCRIFQERDNESASGAEAS